jgi:hypothetical protein
MVAASNVVPDRRSQPANVRAGSVRSPSFPAPRSGWVALGLPQCYPTATIEFACLTCRQTRWSERAARDSNPNRQIRSPLPVLEPNRNLPASACSGRTAVRSGWDAPETVQAGGMTAGMTSHHQPRTSPFVAGSSQASPGQMPWELYWRSRLEEPLESVHAGSLTDRWQRS